MKKTIVVLLVFFLALVINAQTVFQKVYTCKFITGDVVSNLKGLFRTADNGYLVAGLLIQPQSAFLLLKTDAVGDTLWTRKYGPSAACDNIIQTADGGFLLSGRLGYEAIFIKTNSVGDTLWTRTFNAPTASDQNFITSIIEKPDGSFLVFGENFTSTNSTLQILSAHLSLSGSLISAKLFSPTFPQLSNPAFNVLQTSDGGYLLTGSTDTAVVVTKLDSNENVLWSKHYVETGLPGYDLFAGKFALEINGNYLIGAFHKEASWTQSSSTLLMLTPTGNIIWTKDYYYGTNSALQSGTYDPVRGEIAVCAYNRWDKLVFKVDTQGSVLSVINYNNDGYNVPFFNWNFVERNNIIPAEDGGNVIAAANTYGVALIKTDSTGSAGCNYVSVGVVPTSLAFVSSNYTLTTSSYTLLPVTENFTVSHIPFVTQPCATIGIAETNAQPEISVYPNPTTSDFTFEIKSATAPRSTKLTLFDCLGNKVREENITQQKTTASKGDLSPGIYLWQITNEAGLFESGKIIVQE